MIVLHARTVELVDRGYKDVMLRLSLRRILEIRQEKIEPGKMCLIWKRWARKSCCRARRWVWAT